MPFLYKVKIEIETVYQSKEPGKKFPVVKHEFYTCDSQGNPKFFGHKAAMFKAIECLMNFSGED